jgi:magnesium-transporting ATPase (P-type)
VLAKQGFRVLALAYRVCSEPVSALMAASQSDLETSAPITFLGLVYFSNKLKPDTFPATIQGLQNANIHVNMITGTSCSLQLCILCNIFI